MHKMASDHELSRALMKEAHAPTMGKKNIRALRAKSITRVLANTWYSRSVRSVRSGRRDERTKYWQPTALKTSTKLAEANVTPTKARRIMNGQLMDT